MRIEEESGRIEMSSVCLCFYAREWGERKEEKKGRNENRGEKKEGNEGGDN